MTATANKADFRTQTVQEYVANLQQQFRQLSPSRKDALRSKANKLIREKPHMADASQFWLGLSARQVLAAEGYWF